MVKNEDGFVLVFASILKAIGGLSEYARIKAISATKSVI